MSAYRIPATKQLIFQDMSDRMTRKHRFRVATAWMFMLAASITNGFVADALYPSAWIGGAWVGGMLLGFVLAWWLRVDKTRFEAALLAHQVEVQRHNS